MKNSVIKSIINNTFLPVIQSFENINPVFEPLVDHFYNDEGEISEPFIFNFCPNDTKELFEQNLKTQSEDWYYRTHPVKYTLNSLGYRTKEFDDIDWKESIVMFGCSFVFGTGVTDEHTIPYFLEQLSGRPVINMAVGGASIQTTLHNSIILNDSKYPTPKAVVHMISGLNRYQLYKDNSIHHIGEWNRPTNDQFSDSTNTLSFNLMNIKMIRNLWKNKTIYYEGTLHDYEGTFSSAWATFNQEKLINKLDDKICCHSPPLQCIAFEYDKARDLDHPGQIYNSKVAEEIYKKIKPQLDKS
jgi:hypothetical protein